MKVTRKIINLLNIYYFIYKITYIKTGQFYIGVTKDPTARFKAHSTRSKSKHKDSRINRAILVHGKENFIFEIIDGHKDAKIASKQETGWIGQYKDSGYELYNVSRGGECYEEESIERMRISLTGRKLTQDQKDNISKAQKGKITSEATKEKMSKAAKGKKKSAQHCESIRASRLADPNRSAQASHAASFNKGKKRTQKFKDNLSKTRSGENNPIAILTENNVIEILKIKKENKLSEREIGLLFNVNRRTINQIVNNKRWKHIPRN